MKKIFLLMPLVGLLVACQPNSGDIAMNDTSEEVYMSSVLPSFTNNVSHAEAPEDDIWLESLITATPQEGRELAMKMARKTIGAIQSDPDVKKKVRAQYSENAGDLILSAQVVATEFRTVAEANNYWRK